MNFTDTSTSQSIFAADITSNTSNFSSNDNEHLQINKDNNCTSPSEANNAKHILVWVIILMHVQNITL